MSPSAPVERWAIGYRGGVPGDHPKLAVLATAALAGGLLAAGCGGGEEETRPAAGNRPAEGDVAQEDGAGGSSQSSSISQSARSGSGSDQSSSITQRSSGGSSTSSQSTSGGNGVSTFSGTGGTTLSFNVERPSRLVWTNTEGKPFSATGAGISVDSRRGRGEVDFRPGEYEKVKVEGANWTIVVRPR